MTGVQPGGEIGYVFRDGTLPPWAGSRVRVCLFGSYFHGKSTESQSFRSVGQFFTFSGFNGAAVAAGAILSGNYSETLKTEREAFQIGLKLESDIALGPNLSLTPAISVFGGRIHDSYVLNASYPLAATGLGALALGVNERLRTSEIGGSLGARLTWQFLPGFAAHFGGTAGPVWMRTSFTGDSCFNNTVTLPNGAPCGPGFAGFFGSNGSGRDSTIGFRGTASLGLAADMRIAVISIGGFMRYDSRIPGMANPQQTNLTAAIARTPVSPASVRFDDAFAYGGFLTLRVPLPY